MIQFNEIPANLRLPGNYAEFDSSLAVQGLVGENQTILVIGQRLATGTVPADIPTLVTGAEQAEGFFGRGSMLARMFKALKGANRFTETWAIALDDDGAGVAATSTITVTAASVKAGTIVLYVAGERITVGVSAGDTDATIATAISDAINADTALPVTAAAVAAVVTLTARHKGESGNDIDVRDSYYQGEYLPSGVGLAYAAVVAGTSNPDVATAVTAMGEEQYHYIVMPYTDAANLTELEDELLDRWRPMRSIGGVAFTAKRDTVANLTTFGNGRNSHLVSCMDCGSAPHPPEIWAAVYGAIAGENLAIDPARPLQTLELPGLLPPQEVDRRTYSEKNTLLFDGISAYKVLVGKVRIHLGITMYQVNAAGAADPSYLNVQTPMIALTVRFQWNTRMALRFPRHKLADDGTLVAPGQAIATPSVIYAETMALLYQLQDAGLIEGVGDNKDDVIVQRNTTDVNRVDVVMSPNFVNGLRVLAAKIQFRL